MDGRGRPTVAQAEAVRCDQARSDTRPAMGSCVRRNERFRASPGHLGCPGRPRCTGYLGRNVFFCAGRGEASIDAPAGARAGREHTPNRSLLRKQEPMDGGGEQRSRKPNRLGVTRPPIRYPTGNGFLRSQERAVSGAPTWHHIEAARDRNDPSGVEAVSVLVCNAKRRIASGPTRRSSLPALGARGSSAARSRS